MQIVLIPNDLIAAERNGVYLCGAILRNRAQRCAEKKASKPYKSTCTNLCKLLK